MKTFKHTIILVCLGLPTLVLAQADVEAQLLREHMAHTIAHIRELKDERSELLNRYEAQKALLSGRAMREQLPSDPDPLLAWSFNDAGLLMTQQGQLDAAVTLFNEALDMLSNTFTDDHPARGTILQNVAEALWLQRRPEAFERFSEAEAIFEKLNDGHHPRLGALLNSWGTAKADDGQFERAEALYRRAIGVYEQSAYQDAVAPLHNLAVMIMQQGRMEEASTLLQQAHHRLEQAGEEKSLRMVAVLRAMARNAHLQERPRDAERFERRIQRIIDSH